jgi:hypothetical protein
MSEGKQREITDHKTGTNELNEHLKLTALYVEGDPAPTIYDIENTGPGFTGHISGLIFQGRPIKENGIHGVSHEVVLAILIDRLRCYQQSQYACRENALAMTKMEEALMWLKARTANRVARGVEGTREV